MCNLYSMTRAREAVLRLFRISPITLAGRPVELLAKLSEQHGGADIKVLVQLLKDVHDRAAA